MKDKLLFIFTGPMIVLLGAGLLVIGYFEPEVRSFLWPFDGILALIGGLGLTIWVMLRFIPRL